MGNGINGNRAMKRDVGFCLRFHCLFAENVRVRMMSLLSVLLLLNFAPKTFSSIGDYYIPADCRSMNATHREKIAPRKRTKFDSNRRGQSRKTRRIFGM